MKKLLSAVLVLALVISFCACTDETGYKRDAIYDVVREPIAANKPAVERIIAVGNSAVCYYNNEKLDSGAKSYFAENEMFVPAYVLTDKLGISTNEAGDMLLCGEKSINTGADGFVSMKAVCEAFGFDYSFNTTHNTASISKRDYEPSVIDSSLIESAKSLVLQKVKMTDEACGYLFPEAGVNGVYKGSENPGWVGGFYSGINFRCMNWSGETIYKDVAEKTTEKLSGMVMANNQAFAHDIGFIVYLSEYQNYMKNQDEKSAEVIVKAADGLMDRINNGVYIQAWGDKDMAEGDNATRMIIDTMCNLPLMCLAGEITGDSKYIEAAKTHADAAQRFLARKDATAAHTFVFNGDTTGGVERTHQGARDESNWARGLSWYAHGMSMLYEATGEEKYLESSKEFIDTYMLQCEEDLIPRWDFMYQGDKKEPFDTSAAAITACAMMNVYDITADEFYKNSAYYILESLYKNYSSRNDSGSNVVLYHATGNYPQNRNIDVSLIYGDYYFAELIARLSGENVGY